MKRNDLAITIAAIALAATLGAQSPSTQPATPAKGGAAGTKPAKAKMPKDLPAAVRATVETETRNATLKGVSKEQEHGKTVYELESIVDGRTRDLMIDGAGKVYLVEEQLDVEKAPPAVKSALEARGRIVKLESVTEAGKTHYEGQVRLQTGKTVAVEVDADGQPVKK